MTERSTDEEFEAAFEVFRRERFGVWAGYPIDAYTYFAAGWKAARKKAPRKSAGLGERGDKP